MFDGLEVIIVAGYTEEILVKDIAQIYIKEVFLRHGVPTKIILDKDTRFISVFWQVFIAE